MLGIATYVGVALYLVPFAVYAAWPRVRQIEAREAALGIPTVFAADMLSIVALCAVLHLENAVLVSRPAWIGALVGRWWLQRRNPSVPRRPPTWLIQPATLAVAGGSALSVWWSLYFSRDYQVWDRRWHCPMVTSIASQRLPFHNVYEPTAGMHYHYMGDVHAEIIRALSGNVMSSSLALSLSHDVAFGVAGAAIALLMMGLGQRLFWPLFLAGTVIALHGAIVQRDGQRWDFGGHMYPMFLSESFRPHQALSGVLLVGFFGAMSFTPQPFERSMVRRTLLTTAAAGSLTDETSFAMGVAAMGVAWLVCPHAFGSRRHTGALWVATVALAALLPSVALGGSLAPGGPVQRLAWVAARIAYNNGAAPIPMWSEQGKTELVFDYLPMLFGIGALTLLAIRDRTRSSAALVASACVTVAASAFLATKLRINGVEGREASRFFMAPFYIVLVFCLAHAHRMPRASTANVLALACFIAPAFYTIFWMRERASGILAGSEARNNNVIGANLYDVDCRVEAGAAFGDTAVVTYVDERSWYYYTTCRSVFAPGLSDPPWPIKIRPAWESPEYLSDLDKMVPRDAVVPAVCRDLAARKNDRVCMYLLGKHEPCVREGREFVRCTLTGEDRVRLLGR